MVLFLVLGVCTFSAVAVGPSFSNAHANVNVNVNVNTNDANTKSNTFLPGLFRHLNLVAFPRGGSTDQVNIDDDGPALTLEDEAENATDENKEEKAEEEESPAASSTSHDDDDGDEPLEAFHFKASKPGDGSESDPDGLPSRFLRMQKGHRQKAKDAFEATVQWREEHDVNTILARSHPKFDLCRTIFPVYITGRDLANNLIVVQRVGLIDFELGRHNNVTGDDLLMHYVYLCEYCWNILEPGPPDGVMTTVMDLKGVEMKTFRDAEVRTFLRKFVKMMSDNYPQRSYRTVIINAPSWANIAFKFVKPLLRESTKKKIMLLNGGATQDKVLIELLGRKSVPREMLCSPSSLEEETEGANETSPEEDDGEEVSIEEGMRLFAMAKMEANGDTTMLPIIPI